MQLIFQKTKQGRKTSQYPALDLPAESVETLTGGILRKDAANLPELSELQVVRHFQRLAQCNASVDSNFYPLGSCTMKYNPKINEVIANREGFSRLHPYVEFFRAQGTMKLLKHMEKLLTEITGMQAFSLQPMAGAHGEWVGMSIIRQYHKLNNTRRDRVLIPDSSHGTNPASATMAGFKVESVKTNQKGEIDLEDLKSHLGNDLAGIMLTNPNTLGIFESRILEIADLVHNSGGLLYYDGANLNAIMGKCRPGDMGFDVMHLNLHKTFATPHGGGGPGAGPVGVCARLEPYLPVPRIINNQNINPDTQLLWSMDFPQSIGRIAGFFGNIGIIIRAYTYIRTLGEAGLRQVSEDAVLAANYLKESISEWFPAAYNRPCMHEFVATSAKLLKKEVHTLDLAKALIDQGIHPPTIYFPQIVPEAIMIEPTETETLATLDHFSQTLLDIAQKADQNPEWIKGAPYHTPVSRLDETKAAREAIVIEPE